MNRDNVAVLAIPFVIAGLLIGLLFYAYHHDYKVLKSDAENKIDIYESFSANGASFKTSDIKTVDISMQGYANDVYVFTMTDGTRIEAQEGGIIWYKNDVTED